MSLFKRILSFLYPQTTVLDSELSGKVEITWYNGKKMLDTKNANYSYGSLQEVLEYGIHQINLSEVKSILILGMGAGSVIKSLKSKFNFKKHITAVEFDKLIIEIAELEFKIKPSKNLKIIHANAEVFIKKNEAKFDLIIIDLFIDNLVPKQFLKQNFIEKTCKSISKNGFFIFNTMNVNTKVLNNLFHPLSPIFLIKLVSIPNNENILVLGFKKQ